MDGCWFSCSLPHIPPIPRRQKKEQRPGVVYSAPGTADKEASRSRVTSVSSIRACRAAHCYLLSPHHNAPLSLLCSVCYFPVTSPSYVDVYSHVLFARQFQPLPTY
ncbi:hypothetical protein J6590_011077 [Homalodisca vitripennis]|nr:hypothetical protein J6590_011077 [Homalodisca vitripennis]